MKKRTISESGQAATEYILVLAVVMMVALGALYQLNTAFSRFAQNYFGEYLACLLETGELPNLGASQGTSCDSEFEEFSLANGRPKFLPEASRSESEDAAPAEEVSGNQGPRQGPRTVSGRTRSFRPRGARRAGTASARGEGGETGGKGATINIDERSGSTRTRSFSNSRTGVRKVATNFSLGEKEKKAKNGLEKKATDTDSDSNGRQKRMIVKKPGEKRLEEDEEPMTFGKFIKYLLIAGILLAIVVFLGGQILQFSNSDEG